MLRCYYHFSDILQKNTEVTKKQNAEIKAKIIQIFQIFSDHGFIKSKRYKTNNLTVPQKEVLSDSEDRTG